MQAIETHFKNSYATKDNETNLSFAAFFESMELESKESKKDSRKTTLPAIPRRRNAPLALELDEKAVYENEDKPKRKAAKKEESEEEPKE